MGTPHLTTKPFGLKSTKMLCVYIVPTLLLLGCLSSGVEGKPSPTDDLPCASHQDGEPFIAADGCNTCRCRNGRAICTKMMCGPQVPDPAVADCVGLACMGL